MLLGDPSSKSKAQAGSALFLMLRLMSAEEAVEDAWQILFGDPNATIPYGHDYAILAHFALEPDPPAGRRVATGALSTSIRSMRSMRSKSARTQSGSFSPSN